MKNYQDIAEFLERIGWRSDGDAQWTNLSDSLPELRELLQASPPSGGVVLSREHVKFIADILENYDDCGPSGEGWQSQAMTEINAALQAALEAGK